MRMLRKLTAICLALLVLCTSALADVPLLQYAADWQLDETPIEVILTADVTAHMPFDEDRLAMLTAIMEMLSLRMAVDGERSSVTVVAGNSDLVTLAQQGNELYLSSKPGTAYTSAGDPMEKLLGIAGETELSVYGVSAKGETLLTDGWVLLEKLIPDLEEKGFGARKKNTTTIEDMGKAGFRLDASIPEKRAGELKEMLLAHCPKGWLREIISGLQFTGKQTFRIYQTGKDVPLRFEYNGTCGPEGDKRTVKLVWRMRRDETVRDEITFTATAKSGTNKNTLTFERVTKTKKGTVTTEGEFAYLVKYNKQTTEIEGSFDLKNASTKKSDVISGSVTIQQKLPGAKKFTGLTFKPKLTITGTQEAPEMTGTVEVIGKYGKNVTEQVKIGVSVQPVEGVIWPETETVVDLDSLTAEALETAQQEAAMSFTTAIVRPLILLLGEEGDWFFRDMPEEAVQAILDAAGTTLVIE